LLQKTGQPCSSSTAPPVGVFTFGALSGYAATRGAVQGGDGHAIAITRACRWRQIGDGRGGGAGGHAAGTLINKGFQAVTDLTIGDDLTSMDENLGLGSGEETVAVETAIRGLFSIPNPEKTGTNANILTQTLPNQIFASKTGKPA